MPTWLLIAIILIVGCYTSAYMTARIYKNKTLKSDWQVIKYAGSSIEPKSIYICKGCYYKADHNYHYCSNCGARMINGVPRTYYSDKIELFEKED